MANAQTMPRPARAPRQTPASQPRPRLTVVSTPMPSRGTSLFMLACIAILVSALLGSLMLNTVMAKGSYEQSALQAELAQAAQTQDTLMTRFDTETSPSHLAARAKKLGMKAQSAPLLIRLSDKSVIGLDQP